MNNQKYDLILTLLLIHKSDKLNNSYELMRILEWKFRIMDSKKILDQIKEENYAEFQIVNGVHYYKLTLIGKEFISRDYITTLEFLLQVYPNEAEIIKSLFESFSKLPRAE